MIIFGDEFLFSSLFDVSETPLLISLFIMSSPLCEFDGAAANVLPCIGLTFFTEGSRVSVAKFAGLLPM